MIRQPLIKECDHNNRSYEDAYEFTSSSASESEEEEEGEWPGPEEGGEDVDSLIGVLSVRVRQEEGARAARGPTLFGNIWGCAPSTHTSL